MADVNQVLEDVAQQVKRLEAELQEEPASPSHIMVTSPERRPWQVRQAHQTQLDEESKRAVADTHEAQAENQSSNARFGSASSDLYLKLEVTPSWAVETLPPFGGTKHCQRTMKVLTRRVDAVEMTAAAAATIGRFSLEVACHVLDAAATLVLLMSLFVDIFARSALWTRQRNREWIRQPRTKHKKLWCVTQWDSVLCVHARACVRMSLSVCMCVCLCLSRCV